MKKNLGSADKIIRIVIAAIFAILYFTNTVTGIFGIVLLLLAGVFVLTTIVSWCPIYFTLRISTLKGKSQKAGN